MISVCGLNCSACPAFLATQKNDDEERKNVAGMWSKQFNAEIKPEDINCNGCASRKEPHFNYCAVCEIRKCGLERNIDNCAGCKDYACEKLSQLHNMAPEAKQNLEEERKKSGLKT